MARKIEKHDALEHALTLFWDNGYRGTSMDMLTTTLGVEKPSIYANFGSKHQLYLAALARYREWLIDAVARVIADAPSARAGIDQAVLLMMARNTRRTRRGCFATNSALELADHDPLVLREVRATFAGLLALFRDALHRAQLAGEVRADPSAEVLAQLLLNAIEGARVMEKTQVSKEVMASVAALIIEILKV